MRSWILGLAVVLALGAAACAQGVTGDWRGTMHAFCTDMPMVLHITRANDGALRATVDSIGEDSYGVSAESVTLTGGKLTIVFRSISAGYGGVVNPEGTRITGQWVQGPPKVEDMIQDLNLERAPTAPVSKPEPGRFAGIWEGAVEYQGEKEPSVIHIFNTEHGLRSCFEGAYGTDYCVPFASTAVTGSTLTMKAGCIDLSFTGTLAADGETIDGRWFRNDESIPLQLKLRPGAAPPEARP